MEKKDGCGGAHLSSQLKWEEKNRIMVQAGLGKKWDTISKTTRAKKAGGMVHLVEHLLNKPSNPGTPKQNKKASDAGEHIPLFASWLPLKPFSTHTKWGSNDGCWPKQVCLCCLPEPLLLREGNTSVYVYGVLNYLL
jgi:hypothetical protein